MGKNKKIVNNDPILKKDYKYEKRRKERAMQKEREKARMEEEEKIKREIDEVQQQVQKQIDDRLLQNAITNKNKQIKKVPKQLFTKKAQPKNSLPLPHTSNTQILFMQQQSLQNKFDHYSFHFGPIPSNIQYAREHRQSKRDILDRQIKEEIREMFSTRPDQQPRQKIDEQDIGIGNTFQKRNEDTNPYVLVKSSIKQKQLLVNQEVILFTQQAYNTKQTIKYNEEERDFRLCAIRSYKDYVHIQNKQQSTIGQFRRIVISHMIQHQNRCRSDESNSKGFTNAKSLILSPFFGDAKTIIEIFQTFYVGYSFENKQKLETVEDENDFFRIGISVNDRKKIVKYFSHFNVSHFIIGSPVGIKAIVGSEGESERDFSFLSSVEILYVDRASVVYMQNWDHLIEVVKNLNLMPTPESLCNDINKLRPSVPELMSKLYRQSIVFSQFNMPEINALKHNHFHNWEGCITSKIYYKAPEIPRKCQFDIQFYKMDIKEPKDDLEMRFQFFKRKFWDELSNDDSFKKVVIFTRSYFEFIKLRQFLTHVNASAEFISEHTKKSKVQSKIAHFNAGKYRIMVLTERAYYYGICQIKKLENLYFYSLPRNSFIYCQLISQIIKQKQYKKNRVVGIYTKYDRMWVQKVVGSKKSAEMIREYCSNVSFVV